MLPPLATGRHRAERPCTLAKPQALLCSTRTCIAILLNSCRTYGDHGLILETSTHLEDILMSDYFQIEDRFVARPGQEGSIRVDIEVEVSDGGPEGY